MLLNHGELNGHCFLEESSVKEISPYTQLDNDYGYNGYNLCVFSSLNKEKGFGDEGQGLEEEAKELTFWIDPKRDFVGLIMSQMLQTILLKVTEEITKSEEKNQ